MFTYYVRVRVAALLVLAHACLAQQWEIGVAAGYGIYRNGSIYAPAGTATAGVRNRFAISTVVGENLYKRISGEFRYTYHDGDPFLAAGGAKTNIQGQSHAFHYDLLFHLRPARHTIHPYVAVGLGAKLFVATGPENPSAPLQEIGRLTTHDEFKFLFTAGGGLKIRLGRQAVIRLDFRDYITPFPKRLIAPSPLATARGILHQYTSLVGVGYVF